MINQNWVFLSLGVLVGIGVQLTHHAGANIHVKSGRSGPLSLRSLLRKCLTKETIKPLLTAPVHYLVRFSLLKPAATTTTTTTHTAN